MTTFLEFNWSPGSHKEDYIMRGRTFSMHLGYLIIKEVQVYDLPPQKTSLLKENLLLEVLSSHWMKTA